MAGPYLPTGSGPLGLQRGRWLRDCGWDHRPQPQPLQLQHSCVCGGSMRTLLGEDREVWGTEDTRCWAGSKGAPREGEKGTPEKRKDITWAGGGGVGGRPGGGE